MPSIDAWEAFAGVGGVVIFLGSVVFGLQRLGVIGKRPAPAPTPGPAEPKEPPGPSPEALALIEATRALVEGMQAIAGRSESVGRVHARLDDVNREISSSTTEVAELKGQLVQMNKTLLLIHEHLLRQQ